jgi:acetyltransferase-like isoleucine patch superfamily enzyme
MARIFDGVILGDGASVDETAIIGVPPVGAEEDALQTVIGPGAVIRSHTVIYAGVRIGARLNTGHGAMIREDNVLGDDVSVGTNAVLEFGNRLGNRVRVHSGCFLENGFVEDDVFLGPHVVFTDDPHPMCPRYRDCLGGPTVRRQASVGANVTLLPGVEVGEGALIGAGSVVAEDVPPGVVAAGNPARAVKKIEDLTCWPRHFERPYVWRDQR